MVGSPTCPVGHTTFEDDHLPADGLHFGVRLHDPGLQTRHDGTRGVDDADAQPPGFGVGRRRFAVGANQHPPACRLGHSVARERVQPQLFEPLHLDAVVDDVAQRKDRTPLGERRFGLVDSPDHAEAEPRFVVDFDLHGR